MLTFSSSRTKIWAAKRKEKSQKADHEFKYQYALVCFGWLERRKIVIMEAGLEGVGNVMGIIGWFRRRERCQADKARERDEWASG